MTDRKSNDEIRKQRESAAIHRWQKNGGYLVGAFSSDPREPRVWHDEHGDSLDASAREEGDANGGLVGRFAQDALDDHLRRADG